jgi:hypothetical protein
MGLPPLVKAVDLFNFQEVAILGRMKWKIDLTT